LSITLVFFLASLDEKTLQEKVGSGDLQRQEASSQHPVEHLACVSDRHHGKVCHLLLLKLLLGQQQPEYPHA
jgi:hypothetical protein